MKFENSPPIRPQGERGINSFFLRAHFLDLVEKRLDPVSERECLELLKHDKTLNDEFEKFKNAIEFCSEFRNYSIDSKILESVNTSPTRFDLLAKKLKINELPVGFRWGIEIGFVLSILMFGILFFPWKSIFKLGPSDTVILAQLDRAVQVKPTADEEISKNETASKSDQSKVAEVKANEKTAEVKEPDPKVPAVKVAETKVAETKVADSKVTKAKVPEVKVPDPKVQDPKLPDQKIAEVKIKDTKLVDANRGLFRGSIEVTNLSATSNKLVAKLNELGGRRAGQVELGWVKGNTRYFHFTIPEAKYDAFFTFFSQYGELKITKEPHPRTMPQGIVRVILTVSEKTKGK